MPQAGKKTRAGSSRGQGSAAASRDPAVQRKIIKNSDHYAQTINRLDLVVAQQQDALRKARQQKLWEQERQKILVEAIACQEELEHILAAQQELLTKHASTDPQFFSTISAAAAASGKNWGNSRLAAATLQHIMQVKGMAVEDWLQQSRATFPQLAVLLELANRELQGRPAVTAAAAAAAAAAGGGAGRSDAGSANAAASAPSNGSEFLADAAAAGDAAAAAAAGQPVADSMLAADPVASQIYSNASHMLNVIVSEVVTMMYAAMYHNPQPYYHFAACNHATGELQMAPPSALQAVAQRMQLSPLQVLHMRIIIEEFGRLSRAASAEGNSLTEQMAQLSLAAVIDRNEGSSAAGGSSSSKGALAQSAGAGAAVAAATEGLQQGTSGDSAAPASVNGTAAAAAAAAAEGGTSAGSAAEADDDDPGATQTEAMRKQLDRYLRHINIHTVVTAVCIGNTLTTRQLATMIVASYPFAPNAHAVAEACLALDVEMPVELPTDPAAAAADDVDHSTRAAASAGADAPPSPAAAAAAAAQGDTVQAATQRGWRAEVDQHMIERSRMLQQQLQRWWQKVGGAATSGDAAGHNMLS
uniref:Uncharacterized protein n=1 Tax=Tetradesmus obliquus TaxID=3088 RepID=A0A383WI62_TETOB|eukprot:jgi/Sobl393_1/8296/SZX76933.1